mgnify:CR=1 FL=1
MTEDQLNEVTKAMRLADKHDGAFDKARTAIASHIQVVVMAWGMPDAVGNIVETISPFEKQGDVSKWAGQYIQPLYGPPPREV